MLLKCCIHYTRKFGKLSSGHRKRSVFFLIPKKGNTSVQATAQLHWFHILPRTYSKSSKLVAEGNGNPFQHSFLENPMDRGAWEATVHGITRVRHNLVTKPPPCFNSTLTELWNAWVVYRKGRGTRDQTVNIHCTIEKARGFQKNIYFSFLDSA